MLEQQKKEKMCGDAVKEPSSLDLKKKDKAQRT
jgi:hypothetical protein